jgi:hypothetical protein
MTQAISISKAKVLNYIQCPRRLWLEQYNPELEEPSPTMDEALERCAEARAKAKSTFGEGGGVHVDAQRGLRSALEQTRNALSAKTELLFDAAFEFDGVVIQIDILKSDGMQTRIVDIRSDDRLTAVAIDDCAVQAWTLRNLGYDSVISTVAIQRAEAVTASSFEDSFELHDVTDKVSARIGDIAALVAAAREVLQSLEEPAIEVGAQCSQDYPCPFIQHCSR